MGKKVLTRRVTKPPLKGKTRKRRLKLPSDWVTYWGSSEELLSEIEQHGTSDFSREIVRLCETRGESSYYEAKLQFEHDVLLDPEGWYNAHVRVRVHRNHLRRR